MTSSRRPYRRGHHASEPDTHFPCEIRFFSGKQRQCLRPCAVNRLPADLWNQPPLIDYGHWAEMHSRLRARGTVVPLEGERQWSRTAESVLADLMHDVGVRLVGLFRS